MTVKKTPINKIKDLNNSLSLFLSDIVKIGASSKGDVFDETVKDKLKYHLFGVKYISTEQWCSKEKDSIFFNHYKKTLNNNFDFTSIPNIVDNGKKLNLMLVDKPNGSQKWPDLLLIFNGIGLPIEIKSKKTDGIIWNSGIPRKDGLYIFNCYGKSKTTCFLGQHAISDEEILFLNERAELSKKYNGTLLRWSYYSRNMNQSVQNYFENIEYLNKIDRYKFEINSIKDDIKIKNKLIIKINQLEEKYNKKINSRLLIEKETINFIKNLSWSKNQRTDFNYKK